MITNFKLFESDDSSVFLVNLDGDDTVFKLRYSDKIYIMLDSEVYQELSIEIPDTKKLDEDGFFMNPDVKKDIIDVLVDENFIEETGVESVAGDKKTKSYTIL